MKIQLNAAARLTASYTGKHTKDLLTYIQSLGVKLSKPQMDGAIADVSASAADGVKLAKALIADGWTGNRINPHAGVDIIRYTPSAGSATYISIRKPSGDRCQISMRSL